MIVKSFGNYWPIIQLLANNPILESFKTHSNQKRCKQCPQIAAHHRYNQISLRLPIVGATQFETLMLAFPTLNSPLGIPSTTVSRLSRTVKRLQMFEQNRSKRSSQKRFVWIDGKMANILLKN